MKIQLHHIIKHLHVLKKIGLKNYIFFFVYLKGDEFNDRLSVMNYVSFKKNVWIGLDKLNRHRKLAHEIDIKIKDLHLTH